MKDDTNVFVEINEKSIPGLFEIIPKIFRDDRGLLVKTFHDVSFKNQKLFDDFKEEYYSISKKNVLRGLHFQTPPYDHEKLVYCPLGKIIDVVVDLRNGSPTHGKFEMFTLDDESRKIIYIPKGCAHGFLVQSETAIIVSKTTTIYAPENDSGIRWDSVDIPWPVANPIVSKKDSKLVEFKNFKSPFYLVNKNDC
ncbi:MAG: dTDP-4-dehydrorhamnose 3,5-epimerase [Athalassotoga sp.]